MRVMRKTADLEDVVQVKVIGPLYLGMFTKTIT